MAEETMVNASHDPFFEMIGRAVAKLEETNGPLYGAMLVHMPEHSPDDWVLLVGSKSLMKRRLSGIEAIADALKSTLPKKHFVRINRVAVLSTDDEIYIRLSRAFHVDLHSQFTLTSCNVYGLEIDHAVIYVLQPVKIEKSRPRNTRVRRKKSRAART